jgi:hypothetical protein
MAKCNYCKQEMLDDNVNSCLFSKVKIKGKVYDRIDVRDSDIEYGLVGKRCHDCNILVGKGNYHHYGCDMETCPVCGEQFGFCSCYVEEFIN